MATQPSSLRRPWTALQRTDQSASSSPDTLPLGSKGDLRTSRSSSIATIANAFSAISRSSVFEIFGGRTCSELGPFPRASGLDLFSCARSLCASHSIGVSMSHAT